MIELRAAGPSDGVEMVVELDESLGGQICQIRVDGRPLLAYHEWRSPVPVSRASSYGDPSCHGTIRRTTAPSGAAPECRRPGDGWSGSFINSSPAWRCGAVGRTSRGLPGRCCRRHAAMALIAAAPLVSG